MRMQIEKEFFMAQYLGAPGGPVKGLQFLKFLLGEIEARPIDIFVTRHPADRRFFGPATRPHAVADPFQHAHVFGKTRPDKFSILVFAKPVHMENTRGLAEIALHVHPVAEVITHVVTAKRQHRHRIAAHLADCARSGGGHLRTHRCANVNTTRPVERLIN